MKIIKHLSTGICLVFMAIVFGWLGVVAGQMLSYIVQH